MVPRVADILTWQVESCWVCGGRPYPGWHSHCRLLAVVAAGAISKVESTNLAYERRQPFTVSMNHRSKSWSGVKNVFGLLRIAWYLSQPLLQGKVHGHPVLTYLT